MQNLLLLLKRRDVLAGIVLFILSFLLLSYTFFSGNKRDSNKVVEIIITPGESFSDITANLYSLNVINKKLPFRIAGFLFGNEKKIKAGRYKIPNNLNYIQIATFLNPSNCEPMIAVNIYNGITLKGIIQRIKGNKISDADSIAAVLYNEEIAESIVGDKAKNLEGYLLPGDYFFLRNSSAGEIVDSMTNRFKKFYTKELQDKSASINLTPREVIILASIVQGETNDFDEAKIIAGVYLNRLRIKMKLDADPTVQYALPGGWKQRLTSQDLMINSPYNTYRKLGLPPGPINSPGKDAITAVLEAEKHDYLYFCASGNGKHKFATNFTEHQKNAQEYHQWLNSKNIK